jgi:type II secretory pathway component GspD/PulD (secretin)
VIAVRALRPVALAAAVALALTAAAAAQSDRQVKVLLEFKQQTQSGRQGVQGQGGVIVEERSGSHRTRARGGLAVEETTTRVTSSSGLFTVVQDGAAGSILVAQEVPYQQMAYYYDYAAGRGYVTQGVVWQRVGTALAVRPVILPGDQIRVTLTPVISYFTPGGGGTIELVEAATEVIVANGRRLQIGGSTSSLHTVTRQILGYGTQQASQQTTLTLLATIQPK